MYFRVSASRCSSAPAVTSSASPRTWMKRPVSSGSTTSRLTLGLASMLRPFWRSSVVLTRAHSPSWSTHTRLDCGWPSAPIVVSTPQIGRVSRSRCEAGIGTVPGATRAVIAALGPRRVEGDDVGRPDPAQDRDLGLREMRRDGVAEVADRPSGVLRGERVEVLGRARPRSSRPPCRGPRGSGAAGAGRSRGA